MENHRKAVLKLVEELHSMRDEIEEDLEQLVDKELMEEMKKMGIIEG